MNRTIERLENLIKLGLEYFSKTSESELAQKLPPDKWSKKEILGHLIDSGINNLQRFTEIQFEDKPFKIRRYNQDALVKANHYQQAESDEMIQLWISINRRIAEIIKQQTADTLVYQIEIDNETTKDLRFLIMDYVDHLEHHLNQIISP